MNLQYSKSHFPVQEAVFLTISSPSHLQIPCSRTWPSSDGAPGRLPKRPSRKTSLEEVHFLKKGPSSRFPGKTTLQKNCTPSKTAKQLDVLTTCTRDPGTFALCLCPPCASGVRADKFAIPGRQTPFPVPNKMGAFPGPHQTRPRTAPVPAGSPSACLPCESTPHARTKRCPCHR